MTRDHDALLSAVLARPADTLARLVFADYLDESGHPAAAARAAYIRHQVAAADAPDGPPRLRIARLAAELRSQFRDEADAVLDTPQAAGVFATRERGFVAELRATALSLRTHAAALFQAAPVTSLWVEDFAAHTDWMRSALYLRGVTRLKIGPAAWPNGHHAARRTLPTGAQETVFVEAETLIASRHFRAVEHLDLSRNGLGDFWLLWFVTRLADAPLGHALTSLDLSHNDLGDGAASLLASARGLDRLDHLDVRANRLSDGARGLVRRRFGGRAAV